MSPLITALWATFAVFAVERATGTIHVDAVRPDLGALVGALAFFVAWAPFEETLRVLMFNGTRMAFRRTAVAVVLVCVVFGLAHASNDSPEAGLVGMLSRLLVLALVVLTTRRPAETRTPPPPLATTWA